MIAQGRAPTTVIAEAKSRKERRAEATPALEQYPFAWIRAADLHIGGGDGVVAAFRDVHEPPVWKASVRGKALSLAVAGECLLVSTDQGVIYCYGKGQGREPIDTGSETKVAAASDEGISSWSRALAGVLPSPAGYGLLCGGEASHAIALASNTPLQWVVLHRSSAAADRMNQKLSESGHYGRVTTRVLGEDDLPFAANLFNMVVVLDSNRFVGEMSMESLASLVRPAGGLFIDASTDLTKQQRRQRIEHWKTHSLGFVPLDPAPNNMGLALRRKPLEGAGAWTHMYGDPGNSSCSNDQRVAGALQLQWFGPPGPRDMVDRHHRTTPPLSLDGHLFIPGNEVIYGVDAYNGAVLWRTLLPGFRRVGAPRDAGNMAAAADLLYAVAKSRAVALTTSHGKLVKSFDVPTTTSSVDHDWGYLAVVEDLLYGSATKPGASRSGHSREQIAETYYDFVPIVCSDALFCLDRRQGKEQWRYVGRGAILNPTITLGGDRMYFLESSNASTVGPEGNGRFRLAELLREPAQLVALDRRDGEVLWRRSVDFSQLEHHVYLAYRNERLVAVGTRNEKRGARSTVRYDLSVFDAATGEPQWTATQDQGQAAGGSHGEQDHHFAIIGDVVVQEPHVYDLKSGKRLPQWPAFARGGHGCGAISASAKAFFFRAGNPTMCDLETVRKSKVNVVSRPGCWINMIPASGMLLIPEASSGCTCNFPIQSSMAFAPE